MKTFEIILNAAKQKATNKIWGIAQKAYCFNRITMYELYLIQNQLVLTQPNFFRP